MDLGLSGRRALITAASKGLGKACALALAQEGAHVFIAARGEGELEKASTEVRAAGRMAADISDRLVPQRLVDAAATAMGGLDILVSNAGGPPPGTFLGTELEAWDKGYQLTLMSFVRLVKAALPYLDQSDQARIVILTSTSVREPNPNIVLSNAFRSAVTSAAKTLSGELMPKGITVNTLQPGRILTDRILELELFRGGHRGDHPRSGHRAIREGYPGGPPRASGGVWRRLRLPLFEACKLHHGAKPGNRRRHAKGSPLVAAVTRELE